MKEELGIKEELVRALEKLSVEVEEDEYTQEEMEMMLEEMESDIGPKMFEAEVKHVSSVSTLRMKARNKEEARNLAHYGYGEKPDGDFENVDETPVDTTILVELREINED